MTDASTPTGGGGEPQDDLSETFKRFAERAHRTRREREKRNIRIGLGAGLAFYVVFLLGMSAGEHWATTCVRSHVFDDGPDSFTVCDYRVANKHHVDFGSPFAWLGIPHIPGGPYGVIGWGLVLVLIAAIAVVWHVTRPESTAEPD